ncbi:glycoside hydrolase family 13 [Candidatus Sumerlaeota bacterium]|nr:glycoside hydrolase family 13 [Candidatus Sumerlaeota bacterium]
MDTKIQSGEHEPSEFWCFAPWAHAVHLAGDFNAWNAHNLPMEKDPNGMWKVFTPLAPGRYEYKFIIDGHWVCPEPGCHVHSVKCHTCVPNPHGTMNAIIEVD